MAQYTAYANYVIYFRDDSEYNFALLVAGGNNYLHCPNAAANAFGLTYPPPGGPLDPIKGMYTVSYSIDNIGSQINHPAPSGVFLSALVDSVIVPGQAGNPASIFPAGPDMKLVWCGNIVKAGGAANANPNVPTRLPMPQRRWSGGFEIASSGEGGQSGNVARKNRDGSRTIEGIGWSLRNDTITVWNRLLTEYGAPIDASKSWERFYARVRVLPAITVDIWRTHGTPSGNSGVRLSVKADGTILLENINSAGTVTQSSTSAGTLNLNQWYKIDCLVEYNTAGAGGSGRCRVYVNAVNIFDMTVPQANGGLGQNSSAHGNTDLGVGTGSANGLEIDYDDWHNAELPVFTGNTAIDPLDWLAGTHTKKVHVTAFDSDLGTWAGQFQEMNQMIAPPNVTVAARLSSSTALARLPGVTDATDNQDASGGLNLGVVSGRVSKYGIRAVGPGNGTLGYKLAGAAAVMTTITESIVAAWNDVMYRPSAQIVPTNVVPFSVVHDKANDANLDTVYGLQGLLDYVGTWGQMDDPQYLFTNQTALIHNCRYYNAQWAYLGPVPDGPVVAVGGTYVGNGTQQDINLPLPAHFIWIRALSGGNGPVTWFATGLGGHAGCQDAVIPEDLVRVWVDDTGQFKFTVVGTGVNINANAVTFQYIAFCDPGMRWNLCGAFMHATAITSFNNLLVDGLFTPVAMFYEPENQGPSATVNMAYKGSGHAGTTANRMSGTALANLASFAQGIITSGADAHIAQLQGTYSSWRTNDGSGLVMVQVTSYTGNGSNPRDIPLTPVSGRFPLFALVVPHNAVGFFRDPSHAGSNSAQVTNLSNSTTAIVGGGIDKITVQSTLNANGIVYDVFVIPGDVSGWNNGNFFPPNGLPNGNQWPAPAFAPSGDINIIGNGGLILGGTDALTLLKDVSGLYALIPDKTNDTLYDRQVSQTFIDRAIPNPIAKTGFIGG